MPELPEVETIKAAVAKKIGFSTIEKVFIRNRNLRQIIPLDLEEKVINSHITAYRRIAKYIIFDLDNGFSLLWHMGMTTVYLQMP